MDQWCSGSARQNLDLKVLGQHEVDPPFFSRKFAMKSKEKRRNYNLEYYHKRRKLLINQLGGKCVNCGSTENLQFDHIDPASKEIKLTACLTQNIDRIQNEISKCQLLCRKCHIIKTKTERNGHIKVNKEIAIKICEEYINFDITQAELGRKYNLSPRTISAIVCGNRWAEETASIDRSLLLKKLNNKHGH